MAISPLSPKKKSTRFFYYHIPASILLFFLLFLFLWSSCTTTFSGNILHICLSSRKLNKYCLSTGNISYINGKDVNEKDPDVVNDIRKDTFPLVKDQDQEDVVRGINGNDKDRKIKGAVSGFNGNVNDQNDSVPGINGNHEDSVSVHAPVINTKKVKHKKDRIPGVNPKDRNGSVVPINAINPKVNHEKEDGYVPIPVNGIDGSVPVSVNRIDGSVSVNVKHQNDPDTNSNSGIDDYVFASVPVPVSGIDGSVPMLINGIDGSVPLNVKDQKDLDTDSTSRIDAPVSAFVPVNVRDQQDPVTDSKSEIDGSVPINTDSKSRIDIDSVKVVEEQIRIHRSWLSHWNQTTTDCDGKGIFVYDLPSKFNKDLVDQCADFSGENMCKYFKNHGMGERIENLGGGWFETHQFVLEPIFHSLALKHRCRVYDENQAKVFYVPFYGGLDIMRWYGRNVSNDVKDVLSEELLKWLEPQKAWIKNSGKDHAFVLGNPSWNLRRYSNSSWGTRLLEMDQFQNPLKLIIERQPWQLNDIGIPYPTHFHPHSDDDIIVWQSKVIESKRRNLVSFAGAARPGLPDNIRSVLIEQCQNDKKYCRFLDCKSGDCYQPNSVNELFLESEFCLQPPGDTPTRKSFFDSIVTGCIPVLFDPFSAYYQYPWHLPEDYRKYSVFIDEEEVRQRTVNVVERLKKISAKERKEMRRYIVYELLPRIVYGDSDSKFDKFHDAFSIAICGLLQLGSRMDSNVA